MSTQYIQRFQELTQNFLELPGSFFITDANATILFANEAMQRKTGFSEAEMIGKKPNELWGGHMARNFYSSMWTTIRDAKEPFIGIAKNKKKNGISFEDTLHIAPITDQNGTIRFFVEMNPPVKTQAGLRNFQKELQQRWTSEEGSRLLQWMVRKLACDNAKRAAEMQKLMQEHHHTDLVKFLEEICIKPTNQKFYSRNEDRDLVAFAQLSTQAFKRIYEKYKESILQYFLQRLDNEKQLAEDMTQETFLRAFKYLPSFQISNASYQTYLLRVAHNVLVNFYREKKTLRLDAMPQWELVTDHHYEEDMMKEWIWKSLDILTEIERQIIEMKYREDLSIREIAIFLSKSQNAVKLHLSRARKKLKNQFKPK
jgi:RNA polymerase sigma-70 factor (ECF subfamily)